MKYLAGVSRQGNARFGNHLYWFSWESDDSQLRNAKWDWFNARNYCRKRCMDLVSFETQAEYDWVKGFVDGGMPLGLAFKGLFLHERCSILLDFWKKV